MGSGAINSSGCSGRGGCGCGTRGRGRASPSLRLLLSIRGFKVRRFDGFRFLFEEAMDFETLKL